MNSTETRTEWLRERAHRLIPAGAHTYSKADNQFPANAPAFVARGQGARCWDTEGREFVDYGMGIFAVSLGHAYLEIIERIKEQLPLGNTFSRPSKLEGDLAERLCSLIPSAEMVKFAKNGSDVTSAAVRLARYHTGRDLVLRCREQPFHSFNDWFIGSTSRPGGVPETIRAMTRTFHYNNLDSLETIFRQHPDDVACVIMEPVDVVPPEPGFLEGVRKLCDHYGALLIFDEIISGFRWHLGGAQTFYKVTPDLSTFGKGMSNGFPAAALVGRRAIMDHGRMNGPVFLLSCTYGSELVGLTAALATIDVFERERVIEHMWSYGERLQTEFRYLIERFALANSVSMTGLPCRPQLCFRNDDGSHSFELKTLFMQEMASHGILMERICISYSHGESELAATIEAAEASFRSIADALASGAVARRLLSPAVQPVFR